MTREPAVVFRDAVDTDAASIARLHAESWRRHYRDAYPEDFFGPSLDADRLTTWTERLATPDGTHTTVGTVEGDVVAFIHLAFDSDETFGTLIDNLHVRHDLQRRGLGASLVMHGAAAASIRARDGGVYLWVLELNLRAQAFYQAIGGRAADRQPAGPPAHVLRIRYVWDSPQELAARLAAAKQGDPGSSGRVGASTTVTPREEQ